MASAEILNFIQNRARAMTNPGNVASFDGTSGDVGRTAAFWRN